MTRGASRPVAVPMRRMRRGSVAGLALLVGACAAPQPPPTPIAVPQPSPAPATAGTALPAAPARDGEVIGRNERLLIYRPADGETLGGIARRFLGSDELAWTIAAANDGAEVRPGAPIWVPLQPLNPLGVHADRIQVVPILCYHRFGAGRSKMTVAPERFAAQLDWLARNDYHVIRLSALQEFIAGRRPLPPRSVVITIDDGYESAHRHAFPLLRRHGFPATLFVTTDFIGAGDALNWSQLQEMAASGLIDVQAHSKTHRNLTERMADESESRYLARIGSEMTLPRDLLQRRLAPHRVRHLAYPFGDADATVIDQARRQGYELGLTVVPGPNAFFAQPMLLRRTMVFGDMDIDAFKSRLQTEQPIAAR